MHYRSLYLLDVPLLLDEWKRLLIKREVTIDYECLSDISYTFMDIVYMGYQEHKQQCIWQIHAFAHKALVYMLGWERHVFKDL
jgi:hypothetical protein